uniref:Uncharacterized protein n=1 Tax=Janibacter limosus TaxID=53458 RepID=A0AC61U3Q1_9MICO|nr:hypothetical protein [Janibacter limosus]
MRSTSSRTVRESSALELHCGTQPESGATSVAGSSPTSRPSAPTTRPDEGG